MIELKCQFCQQELEIGGVDGILRGCPKCRNLGTEMLWKALIDTKKKLDIAVDALKVYSGESGNWWYGYEFQGHYEDYAGEYADKALERIKDNDKDVK